MSDQSLGNWLRRERERRGITLQAISDQTKVSVPLLQGLEADDLSRWPSGIFRRAFVRAYASAVGLEPEDVVERLEQEHGNREPALPSQATVQAAAPEPHAAAGQPPVVPAIAPATPRTAVAQRARLAGTAADLTIALVLGLSSAAAGSRLLWPVLAIAAYYALGVLLTGTSPMVALLREDMATAPPPDAPTAPEPRSPSVDRRYPARRAPRPARTTRAARSQIQ